MHMCMHMCMCMHNMCMHMYTYAGISSLAYWGDYALGAASL